VASPDIETALHTDRLARDLYATKQQAEALAAELAGTKRELQKRGEEFRLEQTARDTELVSLRQALTEAEEAAASSTQLAECAKADASDAAEKLQILREEQRKLQAEKILALQELDSMAERLSMADGEAASAFRRREAAERCFREQLFERDRQSEKLLAERAELRRRLEVLEMALRRHEARAMAATLPSASGAQGGDAEDDEAQGVEELRRQSIEERVALEASVRELQRVADRRNSRLEKLEVENSCLREQCLALQEAGNRDAAKVRDFDDADAERQQLRSEVALLQKQLVEAQQRSQQAEDEAQKLAEKLSQKFAKDVFRELPSGARPAWMEPVERRAEEAEQLLQQAKEDEVNALSVAHKAREEAAHLKAQLTAEEEEAERLQRRLLEARMRLDQNLERSAGLSDELGAAEAHAEALLEAQQRKLAEEHQAALDRERAEGRASISRLEAAAARREDELASLSRLRAAVGHLESFGGLTSLGRTIAALGGASVEDGLEDSESRRQSSAAARSGSGDACAIVAQSARAA